MKLQELVMQVGLVLLLASGSAARAAYPILCYPGVEIKAGSAFAGCQYTTTWDANPCAKTPPNTSVPLYPTNSGFCVNCINEPYKTQVLAGSWSLFPSNDFTCMSCISQLPLTRAWWSFDENLWESNDLAAGGVNVDTLIASGPGNPPIPGMVRGGWQLNGLQDYIEVADDPKVNFGQGNFTFEGWIKLDPALTYAGSFVLVNKMAGSGPFTGYMIGLTDRRLTLSLANNGTMGTWMPLITSPQVSNSDGMWHHVAVSVSRANVSTGIRFFLDGQQMAGTGNASSRSGSLTNTAPLRFGIGLGSLSAAPRIKIGVDEFKLYNSALSPSNILSIYNSGHFGVCKNFARPDWWPIQ